MKNFIAETIGYYKVFIPNTINKNWKVNDIFSQSFISFDWTIRHVFQLCEYRLVFEHVYSQ